PGDLTMLARWGDVAEIKPVVFGQFPNRWFGQDRGEEVRFLHGRRNWFGFGGSFDFCWRFGAPTASTSAGSILFRSRAHEWCLCWLVIGIDALGDLDGKEVIANINGVADLNEEFLHHT